MLEQVPRIRLLDIEREVLTPGHEVDIVAHIDVSGRRHALLCEVKSDGQPRRAMFGSRCFSCVAHQAQDATPVFIASYLTPEAQALCREQDVDFVDLEGDARLVFDGIFIERQVASKACCDRRDLR